MNSEPTVFIIDDDEAVMRSLQILLEEEGLQSEVYSSCEEFLTQSNSSYLGCLVLDIRLPGMNGLELLAILSQRNYCLPTIIVTGYGDVPMATEAFKKGAIDFIQKPYREYDLLGSIRKAIRKSEYDYFRTIQRKSLEEKINSLSTRDRQITTLMIEGNSDKQIALQISVSRRAVAHHRLALLEKFEVSNTVQLAVLIKNSLKTSMLCNRCSIDCEILNENEL